jgi:hypothetical protein
VRPNPTNFLFCTKWNILLHCWIFIISRHPLVWIYIQPLQIKSKTVGEFKWISRISRVWSHILFFNPLHSFFACVVLLWWYYHTYSCLHISFFFYFLFDFQQHNIVNKKGFFEAVLNINSFFLFHISKGCYLHINF